MKAEYIIKIDGEPDIMGNYPLKDKPQELVRCKDCKFRHNTQGVTKWLPCMEMTTANDWFCADGERRTE